MVFTRWMTKSLRCALSCSFLQVPVLVSGAEGFFAKPHRPRHVWMSLVVCHAMFQQAKRWNDAGPDKRTQYARKVEKAKAERLAVEANIDDTGVCVAVLKRAYEVGSVATSRLTADFAPNSKRNTQ